MTEERELVVLVTRGTDHELSSVAFTIANGGITAGLKVAIFLTSAAVRFGAQARGRHHSGKSIGAIE